MGYFVSHNDSCMLATILASEGDLSCKVDSGQVAISFLYVCTLCHLSSIYVKKIGNLFSKQPLEEEIILKLGGPLNSLMQ